MIEDRNIAYLGSPYPHHMDADLEEIRAMGATSITLTVNHSDFSDYRKARLHALRRAREMGLRTVINLHGFGAFSGPVDHRYFLAHRGSGQILSDGSAAGPRACPRDRNYVGWLKDQVARIVEALEPEAIMWDEPRLMRNPENGAWGCCCQLCRDAFRRRTGYSLPAEQTAGVQAFRQATLLDFLREVMSFASKSGVRENHLCLMPWERGGSPGLYPPGWYGVTDWSPFAAIPELDMFATDPYWMMQTCPPDFRFFSENTDAALRVARQHGKRCQIWVQGVWIKPGWETAAKAAFRECERAGVDSVGVWSFRCEPGSNTLDRGGNVELAWQTIREEFRKAAGYPAGDPTGAVPLPAFEGRSEGAE